MICPVCVPLSHKDSSKMTSLKVGILGIFVQIKVVHPSDRCKSCSPSFWQATSTCWGYLPVSGRAFSSMRPEEVRHKSAFKR